jgi:hypothetical protein
MTGLGESGCEGAVGVRHDRRGRHAEGEAGGGVVDHHGAAGLAGVVGGRVGEIEEGFGAGAGEFEELDGVLVAVDAQQA